MVFFFEFLKKGFFFVHMCNLVNDVETMLTAYSIWKPFLKYE